jgi:periplasmic divalent cation tolerance protein
MPEELVQLLTTMSDPDGARSLARELVERRLAACVQLIGPITSVYRWNGELQEESETLCLMKVPANGLDELASYVRERHPYDTPELTALPSSFADDRYLRWVIAETSQG